MISTPSRPAQPWLAIAGFLVGMAGIAGSITVVFLGMRSVLDVGGQCASGGPFVIAVPCPDGTWTLPLAIFAGLGFAFLAFAGGTKVGGIYASLPGLAWVGLFCALGFNFLQWGIAPPADPSGDSSGGPGLVFVLLGLMFEVMGIVPLVTSLLALRPGATKVGRTLSATTFGGAGLGGDLFSAGSLGTSGAGADVGSSSAATEELLRAVQAFRAHHPDGSVQMPEGADVWAAVADAVARAKVNGAGLTILGGGSGAAMGGPGPGTNLVAELERLTTLHQNGNLTDAEFAAAKQSLIKEGA